MAARSFTSRSVPFAAATALSVSLYAAHTHLRPVLLDSAPVESTFGLPKKPKLPINPSTSASPYIPLGWGSNRYLTLSPEGSTSQIKKPIPLGQFGATPLRDLVLSEKYGAAVDARGDCWMWGAGYDESGEIGRSLKGKNVRTLIPAASKIFCLSKNGRLYAVSASRSAQISQQHRQEQSWWSYLFGTNPGVDFFELQAEGGLKRGERWTSVSAGLNHLLAVTNKGRTFSLPLNPSANSHRQLGTRQAIEPSTTSTTMPSSSATPQLPPAADPRYCRTLTEIPSLSSVTIAQVTASAFSSFARTSTGRVLGWGANESGQIGLGPSAAVEIVSTPVEVVLARNYPGGTSMKCTDIIAAGALTMFVVERDTPGKPGTWVDLLACGNGMSGGLGNGLWSSACTSPVKVKTVSGLQEYSEKQNAFVPLGIHTVSISQGPMSHIFAVLDTVGEAEAQGVQLGYYGKDVMVWGGNADYQLGNGKRSSLAVPQHIPALIARAEYEKGSGKEAALSSGTLSPMPHSRLQLHQSKADAYDLEGKLIKRGVKCEETMVAGWNASVLYNKISE